MPDPPSAPRASATSRDADPAAGTQPDATLSRRRLLRRGVLLAGAVPAAAAVDGLLITPRRLTTSDLAFGGGGERLRILQVSDLHVRGIGTLERQLLEQIHDARADLVVFTGDSIDTATALPQLDALLAELPRTPRMLAIPGNWEYRCGVGIEALERLYERHGIELLVNRSVEIEHRGRRVRVTGIDDVLGGRPDAAAALRDAAPIPLHLVLAHCPVARDRLDLPPEHPATLLLSGHTHGGQVAPCGVAPILPPGCGRYVAGWYRDGGPPLYVSRGIGTSLVPIRIGATPELVRLDWYV
jgi:hypothetical protein